MALKRIRGTGNVFRDLGFGKRESAQLQVRAQLLIELQETIRKRGLTQAATAKLLGVHQPRVSDLVRGRLDLFSIEALIEFLSRLNVGVRVVTTRLRRPA